MVELEQPVTLWMVAHGVPLRNMAVMALLRSSFGGRPL